MHTPRMYYSAPAGQDTKDPAVVRYRDAYWLYYSQPEGGNWGIGIARTGHRKGDTARLRSSHQNGGERVTGQH